MLPKMFGNLIGNFGKLLCNYLYVKLNISVAYAFSIIRDQPGLIFFSNKRLKSFFILYKFYRKFYVKFIII